MENVNTIEPHLSVGQVAKRLEISPRTVKRLIDKRELSAYRIGTRLRIDPKDLRTYLLGARLDAKSK